MKENADSGSHCLQYTHPEFRRRAKEGFNIVVAGKGFGCGSSREQAVMALLGKTRFLTDGRFSDEADPQVVVCNVSLRSRSRSYSSATCPTLDC